LTVRERLEAILRDDDRPLDIPRSPDRRLLGTCRDYALLICAVIRNHGHAARVRCGFATYLGGAPFEDHRLCEAWNAEDSRWRGVDAKLDRVLRAALNIGFEPWDVPVEAYLTAHEAWRVCRASDREHRDFGHGEARGLWFLRSMWCAITSRSTIG
jgi:hypothetical protein